MSARSKYLQELRRYLERCRALCNPEALARDPRSRREREFAFQVEVLGERVQQLREQMERIAKASPKHWRFLANDAERACRALSLSLSYFRGLTPAGEAATLEAMPDPV